MGLTPKNTPCRALTDRRCHTPAVTQPQPYPCSRNATPAQAKVAIWAATLAPSQAGAIKLPDEEYQTDGQIMNDSKYASYFEDCHGALDGIHIDAHVPYEKRIPHRNRKGTLSQKVLAVVTFDLQYCYVVPGWEGFAHDSRVLTDAVANHGYAVPEDQYYLADAGYSNTDYVMIPCRGVRYH